MTSRREFLRMAGVVTAAGLLRVDRAVATDAVEWYSVPLRIPPVMQPVARRDGRDIYEVAMRRARAEILPGKRTPVWAFNGRFPGPTIKARKDRAVVIRRTNRLDVPVSVHLHGGRVAARHDGHPLDRIAPGDSRYYVYPNKQPAATLWYHDHTHHHSSRNNYMGLAGLYLIHDPDEDDLNLPKGRYDVPLVVQDRSFRANGAFRFRDHVDEVVGDVFLVNGRPTPFFKVANRKYRFRILNASNSRGYNLALDTGDPLVQIASDSGLLPAPAPSAAIRLWPSERAEVVIDFARFPVGSKIVLQDVDRENPTVVRPLMRFDVDREETDDSSLPQMCRASRVPRFG